MYEAQINSLAAGAVACVCCRRGGWPEKGEEKASGSVIPRIFSALSTEKLPTEEKESFKTGSINTRVMLFT